MTKFLLVIPFVFSLNISNVSSEPMLGEVRWVAFNFAPRGWSFCNGQVLAIHNNTALFSLLGTTYGGDGRTTFALPDLRTKVVVHAGKSQNKSVRLGQKVVLSKKVKDAKPKTKGVGLNCIIALQGQYPSRS